MSRLFRIAFAKVLSNIAALIWIMKIFFVFKLFIFVRLELCCGFFLQICILRFYCPLLCKILEMSIQEILLELTLKCLDLFPYFVFRVYLSFTTVSYFSFCFYRAALFFV